MINKTTWKQCLAVAFVFNLQVIAINTTTTPSYDYSTTSGHTNLRNKTMSPNNTVTTKETNIVQATDGRWTRWTNWGSCSVTCNGSGTQTRTQECVEWKNGGLPCETLHETYIYIGTQTQSRRCDNSNVSCATTTQKTTSMYGYHGYNTTIATWNTTKNTENTTMNTVSTTRYYTNETTAKFNFETVKPTNVTISTTQQKKPTTVNIIDQRSHSAYKQDIEQSVQELQQSLKYVNNSSEFVQNFLMNASVILLKDNEQSSSTNSSNKNNTSFEVIAMLHKLGDKLSDILGEPAGQDSEIVATGYDIVFSVKNTKISTFLGHSFPNLNDTTLTKNSITLPPYLFNFTDANNASYASIVSFVCNTPWSMKNDAESRNATIVEQIISTIIHPPLRGVLDESHRINLTFEITNSSKDITPLCSFWNYTLHAWSEKGCRVEKYHSNVTVCSCDHLTDFSVLMQIKERTTPEIHRLILHWLTLVGSIVSISCLLLLIFVVLYIRKLRIQIRFQIHINLSIALIIGNILLLGSEYAIKNEGACFGVCLLTFYFFLAAFFWMLCEGVFIWQALVDVFAVERSFWRYFAYSWGIPIAIVGIVGGAFQKDLMSEDVCWLSWKNYAIWMFVAPVLCIILANTIILIKSLTITSKHVQKSQSGLKAGAWMTLILMPLFGSTWVFGVFAVNHETLVFQYIFTILNSLQGFFIFVFYIGCSREVQKEALRMKTVQSLRSSSYFSKSVESNSSKPSKHSYPMADI